ncbi:molybdopterin-dependent oxidoreductase [Actinomadura sp. DC4]|uniref:molybdopterin-dependent oxidoreductase n=1 Tax=Actinomadura sp. DC4 TaxID=3055069 RepID=UPI0025AFA852|nr:molybdopterin-dependent oxidoreductase [Actinomadura sp. DC4]MDN3359409.1 molybdopterin-dependent oxidoreductase [Actinomadura sp. DC4]
MTDMAPEPSTVLMPGASPSQRVRLAGDLALPRSHTVAELRDLPQHTVETDFVCARRGPQRHVFTGPLLFDVVSAAGPRFDPVITKDRARYLLAVAGADGHVAVLSWGEIDPRYGRTRALLATWMDGRALDAEGPHLAVPGDLAGGRYISRIVRIWIGPTDRLTRL